MTDNTNKPEGTAVETAVKFTAIGTRIVRGSEDIARARSHTMAKRIANALNKHAITREGV